MSKKNKNGGLRPVLRWTLSKSSNLKSWRWKG